MIIEILGIIISIICFIISSLRLFHPIFIRKKVFKKLQEIASLHNIQLLNEDPIDKGAAGEINFVTRGGDWLNPIRSEIRILPKYKTSIHVLAHEIGHLFSMKYLHDGTEEGANRMAKKIILDMLNPIERFSFANFLYIYFGDKEE